MTTNAGRETAVIIQFPQRARAVGKRRDDAMAAEVAASRVTHAAAGSGWYHEAAVQEAVDRARRR